VATLSSLPVLSRNIGVKPGTIPQLFAFQAPANQSAPNPGDTVTLTGSSLGGASRVMLANPRLRIQVPPITPSSVTNTSITFIVPNAPGTVPAGMYDLWVAFTDASGNVIQSTNVLNMPIAPTLLL